MKKRVKVKFGMNDKIQDKKYQILCDLFRSKDSLTWNETTQHLNELIEMAAFINVEPTPGADRQLLIDFQFWYNNTIKPWEDEIHDYMIDDFLKSINNVGLKRNCR